MVLFPTIDSCSLLRIGLIQVFPVPRLARHDRIRFPHWLRFGVPMRNVFN